jgi:uncharacterized Zn-finger protein
MGKQGVNFTNTCSMCGEMYKVQEVDVGPWSWQPKEIECPYCKKVYTKKSSGSFNTSR